MKLLLFVIVVCIPKVTKPQSVSTLMGGRSAALGNASGAISDNWGIFNNIAGIAGLENTSVNFACSVNPSLPGGNTMAASFILPATIGAFGTSVFKFGDELYNEQIVAAGYANQFGLASLGIRLSYVQYRAEGFDTQSALSLNFGGIATLTPQIRVGAYILNLNNPHIGTESEESLPAILTTGIMMQPQDNLALLVEIQKDLHHRPVIKGGVEYNIHKKIKARTGFNIQPNSVHGGLGYQSARLLIDYAMQHNPVIKTTSQLSASYLIAKNKK